MVVRLQRRKLLMLRISNSLCRSPIRQLGRHIHHWGMLIRSHPARGVAAGREANLRELAQPAKPQAQRPDWGLLGQIPHRV